MDLRNSKIKIRRSQAVNVYQDLEKIKNQKCLENGVKLEKIVCGSVSLYRLKCPQCDEFNLSANSSFRCDCGMRYSEKEVTKLRVEAKGKRVRLPKKLRDAIVSNQGGVCYWCGNKFGIPYYRKKTNNVVRLRVHIDHLNPFSYTQNSERSNLVASCSVCNLHKSAKMFENESDCREYLIIKLNKKILTGEIAFD